MRYQVAGYSDGLFCVTDTAHPQRRRDPGYSPIVQYHESVGWHTISADRTESQSLADRCNAAAEKLGVPFRE